MARSGESGPNRSTLRRTLEVSLANRKLADELLDAILELQTSYNALLAKMDADFADVTNASVDYESTLEIETIE